MTARGPAAKASLRPAAVALDEADRALFRQAMHHVQPLAKHGARARTGKPPLPEPVLRARRQHAQEGPPTPPVLATKAPNDPHFSGAWATEPAQASGPPDLLRGLRRGQWLPQATLDLHGCSLAQAGQRLDHFLERGLAHGLRCVRIVHGKGYGSRHGGPVLKDAVRRRLDQLAIVQAWAQCREHDGGAGAVHVLIRPAPTGPDTP